MSMKLQGTVNLPGSKSESNRALMISAYGGFPIDVENLSEAHDTVLLKKLLFSPSLRGASATKQSIINCEDAGTVARFLLTFLAGKPGTWTLTGTPRLCERPIAPQIDALRQLGATVIASEAKQSNQYSLPLRIIGRPLKGGSVTLDTSQSSQFASSLLLAAPTWEQGLQLILTGNPVSMPYLEMTIKIMEYYGVQVIREGNVITVPHQSYQPRPFVVSPDWSAASYWYEMMALSEGGDLLLKGLKPNSLQGDAIVAEWFKSLGVLTTFEPDGACLTKIPADPQNLVFDFTDTPDLFPAVYATCYALGLDAVFKGTATLSAKESDRFHVMQKEMAQMGEKRVFYAYSDHRIAMALASLWPKYGPIEVDEPSVVNKSYPSFWKELKRYFDGYTP